MNDFFDPKASDEQIGGTEKEKVSIVKEVGSFFLYLFVILALTFFVGCLVVYEEKRS